MIDKIGKMDFEKLIETKDKDCVSIYMPTFKTGRKTEQNPIRFDNLITEARDKLGKIGKRKPELDDFFQSAKKLYLNSLFWKKQSKGLAVFMTNDFFKYFRLPFEFEELNLVADRFYLKPLFPVLSRDLKFYILGISQDEVRLFECTRDHFDEMDLGELTEKGFGVMDYEKQMAKLQFQTGSAQQGKKGKGERNAMFLGHGIFKDIKKKDLLTFFHRIDEKVMKNLRNENAPLVIAAVDYLIPIYRQANTYKNLSEKAIEGSPEDEKTDLKELHKKVWKMLKPNLQKKRKEKENQYKKLFNQNSELVSNQLKDILKAAKYARIDTLFLPKTEHEWGIMWPENDKIEIQKEQSALNQDLYDLAAVYTYMNGGKIYLYDSENMPNHDPISAIYRFNL